MALAHAYLVPAHGKATHYSICGLVKQLVRKEACFKDSRLSRKEMLNTYSQVSKFASRKFRLCCTEEEEEEEEEDEARVLHNRKYDGKIDKYQFPMVTDQEVDHAVPEYHSQLGLTKSGSLIFSDCDFDFGDLRSRAYFFACDSCLEWRWYDCLLTDQTGQIGKWYIAPSNKKVHQELRDVREQAHKDIHMEFASSVKIGQPLVFPCKTECVTKENELPYHYLIAGRSYVNKRSTAYKLVILLMLIVFGCSGLQPPIQLSSWQL